MEAVVGSICEIVLSVWNTAVLTSREISASNNARKQLHDRLDRWVPVFAMIEGIALTGMLPPCGYFFTCFTFAISTTGGNDSIESLPIVTMLFPLVVTIGDLVSELDQNILFRQSSDYFTKEYTLSLERLDLLIRDMLELIDIALKCAGKDWQTLYRLSHDHILKKLTEWHTTLQGDPAATESAYTVELQTLAGTSLNETLQRVGIPLSIFTLDWRKVEQWKLYLPNNWTKNNSGSWGTSADPIKRAFIRACTEKRKLVSKIVAFKTSLNHPETFWLLFHVITRDRYIWRRVRFEYLKHSRRLYLGGFRWKETFPTKGKAQKGGPSAGTYEFGENE